jgi:mono/diheme cytochrome c family protein
MVVMPGIRTTSLISLVWTAAVACLWLSAAPLAAEDHPGLAIYREHCGRCHGDAGAGTPDVPEPLVGDRSVNQLAAYIHETMPEDDT